MINKEGYDFISKENTLWFHGFLAVLVFISHIPSYLSIWSGSIIGSILQSFGSWCVGCFFFLSGYGLYISYKKKGESYLRNFIKNRILPLYVKYIILLVCYILLLLVQNHQIKIMVVIQSLTFTNTYVANGWYLQVLFLFYIAFYYIFKTNFNDQNKVQIMLLFVTVYYLLFYVYSLFYEKGYFGINSTFCFFFGIIYAYKKNSIDNNCNKHKLMFFFISLLSFFIGGIALIIRSKIIIPKYLMTPYSTMITMSFALGALILIRYVNLNYSITRLLGKYSFEIYVLQGIGFLVANNFRGTNSLKLLLSIVITSIIVIPFHFLFSKVEKWIKTSTQKYHNCDGEIV